MSNNSHDNSNINENTFTWPPLNNLVYIGQSDVTVICGDIAISILWVNTAYKCEVKWWRSVALLEQNWIRWIKKMFILSVFYWEIVVTVTSISQSLPHIMVTWENSWQPGIDMIWRNYITVTLCISYCNIDNKYTLTRKPRKGAAVIAASMHGFASCRKFKWSVTLTLTLDRVKAISTYAVHVGLPACWTTWL